MEIEDPDGPIEEEPWLENPVMGAEELLRFSRGRQLLIVVAADIRQNPPEYASLPKTHEATEYGMFLVSIAPARGGLAHLRQPQASPGLLRFGFVHRHRFFGNVDL